MASSAPPPDISIIEQMAAEFHRKGPSILPWGRLSKADRTRLIGQMAAAVQIMPDRVLLKSGPAFADIDLGQARDALIADLDGARRSVLS